LNQKANLTILFGTRGLENKYGAQECLSQRVSNRNGLGWKAESRDCKERRNPWRVRP